MIRISKGDILLDELIERILEERLVRELHVTQRENASEEAANLFLWHLVAAPQRKDDLEHHDR